MPAERYLLNENGRRVDRRWLAGLVSFGVLLLTCPLSCIAAGGLASDTEELTVCGFALAFLCLLAGALVAWVIIFRVAKRIGAAQEHLERNDIGAAVREAQSGLTFAFRADFRTKGYYVLAMCAERAADFADSAHLLELAREALPAMAAPVRKRRAIVLIEAHRALAFTALGDEPSATAALRTAHENLGDKKGAADLLLDDGDWGLGTISLNSVLMSIERRKDPQALLHLVHALLAYRRNDEGAALDLLHQDQPRLAAGLLPHELDLARALDTAARARLDPAYRAPAAPASTWSTRILDGPSTHA